MARPQVFDAADLAAAGLELVARAGWSSVSVRALAAELEVSPMALYRVAPDAEGLRRLIAGAAADGVVPAAGGVPAGETLPRLLRAWAVDAYAHLRRYPGLASYLIRQWTEVPGWLDVVESLLAEADAVGLTGAEAVAAVNAVFAYVLVRAELHDAAAGAPRRKLAPLTGEPRRYPFLRRNRAEFATAQTNKHFTFGLDLLIAGLESRGAD